MEKLEQFFLSKDQKTNIHMVTYSPYHEPKAIIQIVHGVTEHISRYEEFANYFTNQNILVVGIDLLGHGLSTNNGTKKMYFGPSGSFDYVVEDINTCYKITKEKYPNIPYIILGFSLGSFLSRKYLIEYPNNLDAAIIIGTGDTSPLLLKLAKKITLKEIKKYGEESFTPKIKSLTFGTYNKKFKPNKTDYDWLCQSETSLNNYLNDNLRGEAISCGLFREMLDGMLYTNNSKNIIKMNKKIPILLLSGSQDPVGDFTKGIKKYYKKLQKNNIQNVTLKIYDNLRHDILHEDSYLTIFNDINEWLNKNILK